MKAFQKALIVLLITLALIVGGLLAALIVSTAVTMHRQQAHYDALATQDITSLPAPELEFAVEDASEPLPMDTYELRELPNAKSLYIYDAEYLDLFFPYDSVTAEQVKRTVETNAAISQKYKELLYWYIDAIASHYPEADLRPLEYNLQTLEVVECTTAELAMKAVSLSSYGCYVRSENKIYVNREYEYTPGTWEYQVIVHEFGHAARSVQRKDGWDTLQIQLSAEYMEIPEEALNSLFTVSLFDYEERDIAYQLQSNLFGVMLECLDGEYSLSDYINHSLSYLARKLDQRNGDCNYAMTIFRLIQEQRKDYMDDRYEREQETYYPIYHYVCKLYLDRYAPENASPQDIRRLVDTLLEKVCYDVPEEYHLDTEEFYRFAAAN